MKKILIVSVFILPFLLFWVYWPYLLHWALDYWTGGTILGYAKLFTPILIPVLVSTRPTMFVGIMDTVNDWVVEPCIDYGTEYGTALIDLGSGVLEYF